MMRTLLFITALSLVSLWSCKSEGTRDVNVKDSVVNVKEEVQQTAEQLEDSTGKVDVQKLEQMMEDAK